MMLSFMNPNTNLTAPAQSPAPNSKRMILNSICEYLEKNGFSKSVKKLRGEAKIEEDSEEGGLLDLEALCNEKADEQNEIWSLWSTALDAEEPVFPSSGFSMFFLRLYLLEAVHLSQSWPSNCPGPIPPSAPRFPNPAPCTSSPILFFFQKSKSSLFSPSSSSLVLRPAFFPSPPPLQHLDQTPPPISTAIEKKLSRVSGLSWSVDEKNLVDAFSSFGDITEVRIMYDKDTGRSRGFGFVYFSEDDSASHAKDAMDGKALLGPPLRISFALKRVRGAPVVVPRLRHSGNASSSEPGD
ncbi:hypothetical protein Droror1_Dr00000949 [Drosera rotundifolia]